MQMLIEHKILWAPDYAINAGGLINVASELEGYSEERAMKQAGGIYDILAEILKIARTEKISTSVAANRLAEARLARISGIKQIYAGRSEFVGRQEERARDKR